MTTRPRRPKPLSERRKKEESEASQEEKSVGGIPPGKIDYMPIYGKSVPPEERTKIVELFPDQDENDSKKKVGRVVAGRPTSTAKDEDGRKLDDRNRIRVLVGKRWSQIIQEVREGVYTWEEFAESLDPEELARGKLRDGQGGFRGRPPTLVPAAFHQACTRELQKRFSEEMRANLLKAAEELIKIGMNDDVETRDRIKVLTYVIERVMGKIPEKVEVKAADPWETIISEILTEEGSAQVSSYDRRKNADD